LFQRLNIIKQVSHGLPAIIILLSFSCSPAKYLPEGDYLLSRNRIETTKESKISKDQLDAYVLQAPNKRLIGTRFYLFLYNLSNIKKEKWPHGWLRKIGEEPVVYDTLQMKNSTEQLKQFLENKGYYNAYVEDSVYYKKHNAYVSYDIEFNEPYKVKKIFYYFEDTTLVSMVLPDTVNSLLYKKMRYDKDILQQERVRIENMLKEHGYFNFSKEYIFYNAITNSEENSVDLTLNIKEYGEGKPDPYTKIKVHPKYRIGSVFVFPNFSDTEDLRNNYDTTFFRNMYFLTTGKPNLRPNVVANRNYIIPDDFYKLSNITRSYRNLSALSIVRFTNITFKEIDTIPVFGTEKYLDCRIEITQKKLQLVQPEIAGTNTGGDFGVRGNLLYSNFNLFRGAEVFNTRLTGAIESLRNQSDNKFKSMKEIGAETSIVFPKFFSPFKLEGFVQKYAPKTSISVSFKYQSRPDFTRSIANSSFSYRWNGNNNVTHTLWPLELSYVNIYEDVSQANFLDSIRTTPLGFSFEDHVINDARYTFELNNRIISQSRNFMYLRFNIESAGNLLNLVKTSFEKNDTGSVNTLLSVPYFQYLMSDIDIRFYNVIDKQNRFVYRLFLGAGYPFGNSKNLPYEKKYFSGGPNSVRAWDTRNLGPGSDTTSSEFSFFPNKNGDIKLEANIEYRFKLIWKIESAIFLDAGNVWEFKKDVNKPGANFAWNRFYKEIAVGTGFGLRFDFSFFLLRIDVGIKLHDPALPIGDRWFHDFKGFGMRDLHFKFGIGYPF